MAGGKARRDDRHGRRSTSFGVERPKIARAQLTGLSDLQTNCEWRSPAERPATYQAPSSSAEADARRTRGGQGLTYSPSSKRSSRVCAYVMPMRTLRLRALCHLFHVGFLFRLIIGNHTDVAPSHHRRLTFLLRPRQSYNCLCGQGRTRKAVCGRADVPPYPAASRLFQVWRTSQWSGGYSSPASKHVEQGRYAWLMARGTSPMWPARAAGVYEHRASRMC